MTRTFVMKIEILMHLRSLKKSRGEVSIYDPIGMDKEGNELPSALYLQKGWGAYTPAIFLFASPMIS